MRPRATLGRISWALADGRPVRAVAPRWCLDGCPAGQRSRLQPVLHLSEPLDKVVASKTGGVAMWTRALDDRNISYICESGLKRASIGIGSHKGIVRAHIESYFS